MFFIDNISLLSTFVFVEGIISLVVAAVMYTKDIRNQNNLFFFLFSLSVGLWSIMLSVFNSIHSGVMEYMILTGLYVFAAVALPLLLLFLMSLPSKTIHLTSAKIFLISLPVLLVVLAILTPNIILESVQEGGVTGGSAKQIIFGAGLPFFVLYVAFYIAASFIVMVQKYSHSAGIYKTRSFYMLLVLFGAVLLTAVGNVFLPSVGFFNFMWLGPTVVVVAIGFMGYLVVLYNFWNLYLVITELFVFLMAVVLLLDVFVSSSPVDFITKPILLVFVALFSAFLITSARREISGTEKMKSLADDLVEANKDLIELDQRKSQFVASAAFHLRDPLTAIKGYASLLLEGSFGVLPSKVNGAVERVFESSQHLSKIVSDFGEIIQIEKGEMAFNFSTVDFTEVVQDVIDEISFVAQEAHVKINFTTDNNGPYTIVADPDKIRQVVSNVLDNAIKYSPEGSVELTLSKNKINGVVVLAVTDTGIGMEKDTLEKIFEKFNRGKDASKYYTGGTGLGLYVAREVLRKHNGVVWAESDGLDKGSTFYITFKIKEDGQNISEK